nr:immunoglobulin heavy chain junction region [Macaca mulatta]
CVKDQYGSGFDSW